MSFPRGFLVAVPRASMVGVNFAVKARGQCRENRFWNVLRHLGDFGNGGTECWSSLLIFSRESFPLRCEGNLEIFSEQVGKDTHTRLQGRNGALDAGCGILTYSVRAGMSGIGVV